MLFKLTPEQEERLSSWVMTKEKVYCGAIGGRFTYSFTPTSIGLIVKVKDELDGTELDLSDYNDW